MKNIFENFDLIAVRIIVYICIVCAVIWIICIFYSFINDDVLHPFKAENAIIKEDKMQKQYLVCQKKLNETRYYAYKKENIRNQRQSHSMD